MLSWGSPVKEPPIRDDHIYYQRAQTGKKRLVNTSTGRREVRSSTQNMFVRALLPVCPSDLRSGGKRALAHISATERRVLVDYSLGRSGLFQGTDVLMTLTVPSTKRAICADPTPAIPGEHSSCARVAQHFPRPMLADSCTSTCRHWTLERHWPRNP